MLIQRPGGSRRERWGGEYLRSKGGSRGAVNPLVVQQSQQLISTIAVERPICRRLHCTHLLGPMG